MIAIGLTLVVIMFAYVILCPASRQYEWYLGRATAFEVGIALGGLVGSALVVAGLVKLAWTYLP
jgi:nitrate reductase gamma subunit